MNDEEFTRYVTILFQDYQLLPIKVIENVVCKTLETLTPGDREKFNNRSEEHTSNSRSEEHTSELQSLFNLVCRLLLEKKKSI